MINDLVGIPESAFIAGRFIVDSIATVEDLVHYIKRYDSPGTIINMDFIKAFNIVDWYFLLELLVALGFGDRWISWIKCILYSSKASLLINGFTNDYIRYQRGLRQPCPLCCSFLSQTFSELCSHIRLTQECSMEFLLRG